MIRLKTPRPDMRRLPYVFRIMVSTLQAAYTWQSTYNMNTIKTDNCSNPLIVNSKRMQKSPACEAYDGGRVYYAAGGADYGTGRFPAAHADGLKNPMHCKVPNKLWILYLYLCM